jgi:arsenite methyltransferase
MSELVFDEALAKRLEALYATADIRRRRRLVREALAAAPGERILDVGCGPGFYVADLLEVVGPDGSVVGVDGSAASVAAAAKRCDGHDNVTFHEADAASLPAEDAEFDAAVTVQTLEYLPDPTAALAEMHRALRPGGRVVVWDVDWATVSWRSADQARMDRVLAAWDSHLIHVSLPQTLTGRLRAAGFGDVRMEGHVFATNDANSETYGGYMVSFVERFVADNELIDPAEAKAWADEQRALDADGEFYFACIQFCFSARRAA